MIFALMKWILVLLLLATGIFFLLHGLGVDIPAIEYKGLKTGNIPAGLAVLATAIALAAFWKITIETRYEAKNKFGSVIKSSRIMTIFTNHDRHDGSA